MIVQFRKLPYDLIIDAYVKLCGNGVQSVSAFSPTIERAREIGLREVGIEGGGGNEECRGWSP